MHAHFLTTDDGARIAWHSTSAAPPRALLIHGWMASHRVWGPLLAELPGFSLAAIDLRGSGDSTLGRTPISLARMAADVREVLAAIASPVHLVGHSMGGQLAQWVAAAESRSLHSLTLLNPVPMGGLALPVEVATGFRAAGGQRAAFEGILGAACRTLPIPLRDAVIDDALKISPEVISAAFDAWSQGAPSATLDTVDVRTCVVATEDPFLPVPLLQAQVVQRIRGATLEVLEGPGHYPQLEAPAQTAALLRQIWSA